MNSNLSQFSAECAKLDIFFHENIAQIIVQRQFIEHLKMGVADAAVGVKNAS